MNVINSIIIIIINYNNYEDFILLLTIINVH